MSANSSILRAIASAGLTDANDERRLRRGDPAPRDAGSAAERRREDECGQQRQGERRHGDRPGSDQDAEHQDQAAPDGKRSGSRRPSDGGSPDDRRRRGRAAWRTPVPPGPLPAPTRAGCRQARPRRRRPGGRRSRPRRPACGAGGHRATTVLVRQPVLWRCRQSRPQEHHGVPPRREIWGPAAEAGADEHDPARVRRGRSPRAPARSRRYRFPKCLPTRGTTPSHRCIGSSIRFRPANQS